MAKEREWVKEREGERERETERREKEKKREVHYENLVRKLQQKSVPCFTGKFLPERIGRYRIRRIKSWEGKGKQKSCTATGLMVVAIGFKKIVKGSNPCQEKHSC